MVKVEKLKGGDVKKNDYKKYNDDTTKLLRLEENIHSRSFMLEVLKELAELYYDKDG